MDQKLRVTGSAFSERVRVYSEPTLRLSISLFPLSFGDFFASTLTVMTTEVPTEAIGLQFSGFVPVPP